MLFRQFAKVGAILDLFQKIQRQLLFFYQDMQCCCGFRHYFALMSQRLPATLSFLRASDIYSSPSQDRCPTGFNEPGDERHFYQTYSLCNRTAVLSFHLRREIT
ncbi:hypothetical protein CKO_00115 [Citrobacter koseri ATCC BAA-895]|uniref:Uncharacterized protein n=1 Tax=Citrobacter koseri (strain ATCC BAA-895 / CDC 4225-83 / SGSC4696) TaxID=290338 RepID=A8ACS7_CITK8|nr:hypothetical protein CKO_00115 [Citrobacter koseri ATCC BAA-895]